MTAAGRQGFRKATGAPSGRDLPLNGELYPQAFAERLRGAFERL
jgi:hypothetical protein